MRSAGEPRFYFRSRPQRAAVSLAAPAASNLPGAREVRRCVHIEEGRAIRVEGQQILAFEMRGGEFPEQVAHA